MEGSTPRIELICAYVLHSQRHVKCPIGEHSLMFSDGCIQFLIAPSWRGPTVDVERRREAIGRREEIDTGKPRHWDALESSSAHASTKA